jgi:hypothetical protein
MYTNGETVLYASCNKGYNQGTLQEISPLSSVTDIISIGVELLQLVETNTAYYVKHNGKFWKFDKTHLVVMGTN